MSNTNWKSLKLLLALAIASAPLARAETVTTTNTNGVKKAAPHKKGSKRDKSENIPTGLNHDATIVRNFKRIPGESRLLFYNPTTNVTRAIGIDGKTQYHLTKGKWEQQVLPADMSGFFAVSTSGKALSDSQIDALVKVGDLAALADHAITTEMIAQNPSLAGTTILTPEEVKAIEDMRNAAIKQGNIFVAGLSADGKLVKNAGITNENLKGKEWKDVDSTTGLYELPGGIRQVSINGLSHIWGINEANEVVFKASLDSKDEWEQIPGLRKQIAVNNHDHVWSLGTDGKMFVRLGITNVDANGSGWAQVPGWAINIAINDNNMVYHIGSNGIYFRKGVTATNPAGTDWMQIQAPAEEPKLRQISINNQNQLWAIGANTGIAYVLNGVTPENPAGTTWTALPGKLKQIRATNNGAWCIDNSNKVFFRENVTTTNPAGSGWAGPFPHDLTYIFASGTRIAEPVLTPAQAKIKDKQTNARLARMKSRLKALQAKYATATGEEKAKLNKAVTALEARIAKLSTHPAADTKGKKAGKNKNKKATATAKEDKKNKNKKNKNNKKATATAEKGKKKDKNKRKNEKAPVGSAATPTTQVAGVTTTAKADKKKDKTKGKKKDKTKGKKKDKTKGKKKDKKEGKKKDKKEGKKKDKTKAGTANPAVATAAPVAAPRG